MWKLEKEKRKHVTSFVNLRLKYAFKSFTTYIYKLIKPKFMMDASEYKKVASGSLSSTVSCT